MPLITAIVVLTVLYVYAMAVTSARVRARETQGAEGLFFVLVVPALNEERVIGGTVASLLELRGEFVVLVIDDGSDDGTAEAVLPFTADPRVLLMKQPPEQARRGKGHVLNAGYAAVQGMGLGERYGPENVVMVVFDSDARVEPNFLEAVAPYFRDPTVAGVQSGVRMYNADENLLTLWQHLEFAVWGKLFCNAKNLLGSATLGGNGQCARLAALADLDGEPWRPSSLTEDLDLSLRLLMKGWKLRFCPSVAVRQEAVTKLRALVRQRGRWLQGHLACWQYLPALIGSRRPFHTRLDLLVFLLLPAVFLPVGLASVFSWLLFVFGANWDASGLLLWYALAFPMAPLVMLAWLRTDHPPLWRLLLHGHLFTFYSSVWFLAGVVVYWHVLLGRRSWAKTSRAAPTLAPVRPNLVTPATQQQR